MQSVVHNCNYLLALLLKHSLRTSICVCKYLYMVSNTNSVFHHFPLRGRWPWLLCRPHQVHGHFKQAWIFLYYPWKWLFLSGCWWCQFSIIDYRTGNSHNCIHTYARMLTFCVTAIMYYIIINLPYAFIRRTNMGNSYWDQHSLSQNEKKKCFNNIIVLTLKRPKKYKFFGNFKQFLSY